MTIKAVETTFRGNKFRSRLEARWAVFLDTLNVQYVYEPETFELPTGWYLPDFWIEEWDAFLEVKPVACTDIEYRKCDQLAVKTGKAVYCVQGQPWPDEYSISPFGHPELRFRGLQFPCEFGQCRNCEALQIIDIDSGVMVNRRIGGVDDSGMCCGEIPAHGRDSHKLMEAFQSARSARFEFLSQRI